MDQVGSQSLPSKSKGHAKDDSDEAGIRTCQACMDCLERYIISYNINNYRQLKNRNLFEMVTFLKWTLFSHFFTIYTVSIDISLTQTPSSASPMNDVYNGVWNGVSKLHIVREQIMPCLIGMFRNLWKLFLL